jgi:DhnA family fructose-bisphosphate aldolase class Ia
MLPLGKKIRLERIKHRPSGKFFFVTVDHSIARGVFPGLVNMKETMKKIVAGRPDGITMHKGTAQDFFYPYAGQVSLILKASTFSPYQPTYDTWVAWVDEAVRLGADAISMGVLMGGNRQAEMLHDLGLMSREASLAGMPLIAHIYPKGEMIKAEDQYSVEALSYAVRAGAELGVDIIKTWYPGSPDAFAKVVEVAPGKVVAAGGPKTETEKQFLEMTRGIMDAGAMGVAYGRNVWDHRNPTSMIKALKAIIHANKGVDEAMEILRSS